MRIMKHRRKKLGLVPGSVVFTGSKKVEKVLIHYLQYDEKYLDEKMLDNHGQLTLIPSPEDKVDWYDIRGLHDTELIERFGEHFNIHPLILEGVVDIHQRPKFEEYSNGIFVTLRALTFDKITFKVHKEHVAIYFNKGFVATFQETDSDLFVAIRDRVNASQGRIRQRGSDYLVYAIIDALVDHYYVVLEDMEEVIETLEEKMMAEPDTNSKGDIHRLKKELLQLRKSVSPLREAVGGFAKSESELIQENSYVFIRDLYEHTVQIMDTVDTYRDVLNGLQDLYISEVSFRMNKVMQLLTLISVIFIPLTFLAGIYGMNFDNIPELHYKYGYFVLLGVMLVLFIVLLVLFKRKKWM
jgi:magnesium transporter